MYSTTATYRGSNLPAFSSSDNTPLFGRRRAGAVDWDRAISLSCGIVAVFFLCVFLYEAHRVHLLGMENTQLQREVKEGQREATALRASLSNQQQVHDGLQGELYDMKERHRRADHSLSQSHQLRESLQEELRDLQRRLQSCEWDAKKREEELEAQVAKITQERNDCKIRVDTEHAVSIEWAKKLAAEKAEKELCLSKFSGNPDLQATKENAANTSQPADVDLGRKASAGDGENTAKDTSSDTVESVKESPANKHRMDLN